MTYAGLAAAATLTALAGVRLALCLHVVLAHPRGTHQVPKVASSPSLIAESLFVSGRPLEAVEDRSKLAWHEFGMYIGIPAAALLAFSLIHGWRWWHLLFALGAALSMGNIRWHHAGYWTSMLPILSSMRVPTRWRILAMLGASIGAGDALAGRPLGRWRWLCAAAAMGAAAFVAFDAWKVLAETFIVQFPRPVLTPLKGTIVQYSGAELPPSTWSALYSLTHAGRGVIRGYEPLIAHGQGVVGALGMGDEGYIGEFGPADSVRQTHWSPNRVVLEGPPGQGAWLNQNLSTYWIARDGQLLPSHRMVDRARRLQAIIPADGVLDLRIRPPGMLWAAAFQLLGLVGCLGVAIFGKPLLNEPR
jgi:hypothetical protein